MVGRIGSGRGRQLLMHPGYSMGTVYMHRDPVDFRKQINGLSAIVEQELALTPFTQALFVFINRRRTSIKILYWHRNGFCLWQKRLERDRFHWPSAVEASSVCTLSAKQLEWLLEGFDLWRNKPHKSLNYKATM